MTNSLDPDQARRFVGPDLDPNCLPRLLADDTGRQRVNRSYRTQLNSYFDPNVLLSSFFLSNLTLYLLLLPYSPACVEPGQQPRIQVFF